MGKISIKGADGQLIDFHVGTKYAKTIDRFFFAVEYMEVVEEPVVTVNRDHKCFMAWEAKNRRNQFVWRNLDIHGQCSSYLLHDF